MISLAAATGLVDAIEAAGCPPDRLLRPLGLTRSTLADPHGFIPSSDFAQLLEDAARATGDESFGLHFGERFHPKNIGLLMYVVVNSPTVGAALENVGRYLRVHNQAARSSVVVEGGRASARHEFSGLTVAVPRQQNEFSMAVAINTIRLMAGTVWVPIEVQFAHAAPHALAEHTRIFGAPVSFGHETNALVMEREFLERHVPAADRRLYPILRRYLESVLAEMPAEDRLLATIRRAIGESIRDGSPKLGAVARKVAMSPRSLQRQLKEYGTEFNALVDDTRRRFASHYLRDRKHTLTEIAYLVGYSEVSAFNRAFKRWTGSTPADFRREALKRA
jgi:AraC-like DNA-binding protein